MIKYIAIGIWSLVGLGIVAGIAEHATEAIRPPKAKSAPLVAIPKASLEERFGSACFTVSLPSQPIPIKVVEVVKPADPPACTPPKPAPVKKRVSRVKKPAPPPE